MIVPPKLREKGIKHIRKKWRDNPLRGCLVRETSSIQKFTLKMPRCCGRKATLPVQGGKSNHLFKVPLVRKVSMDALESSPNIRLILTMSWKESAELHLLWKDPFSGRQLVQNQVPLSQWHSIWLTPGRALPDSAGVRRPLLSVPQFFFVLHEWERANFIWNDGWDSKHGI